MTWQPSKHLEITKQQKNKYTDKYRKTVHSGGKKYNPRGRFSTWTF